ncbi:MAG: MBL fold metallo-hydrolase [Thermoanaerobaculia bacterium]
MTSRGKAWRTMVGSIENQELSMNFKRLFLLFAVCALASGCASVPPPSSALPELAPGVWLLRGAFVEGAQPDGNTLILQGSDGLLVIDTGRHRAHTEAILAFARQRRLPIRAVINTHWHLDHVGGNVLLRDSVPGLQIHGSSAIDGALEGFLANYHRQLKEIIPGSDPEARRRYEAELALIDAGRKLAPDETITSSGVRSIAGRKLELRLGLPAVTAGDVRILDIRSGILAAGDLVTLPVPFLDTACPSGWRSALDDIAGQEFHLLVPGHGEPMSRAEFAIYRRAFGNLLDCGASDATKESCASGWIMELGTMLPESEHAFTRRLMDYYVEALRSDPGMAGRCR